MITRDRIIELMSGGVTLSEIIREAASDVIAEVLLFEARRFVDEHQELMDDGKRRLVFNGRHQPREVLFPFGPVTVKAPRVVDRNPGAEPLVFTSSTIPRYLKRSHDLNGLIPWMYLKGFSESDFQGVFEAAFGPGIQGLSTTSVGKLMDGWGDELLAWRSRDMTGERYAYLWADGVYFRVRGERENVCQLMVLGVGGDGRKRLVGMSEGYAESADCWRELLVGLRSRGMEAPKLVIGDGGLGLWSGLGKVFPDCGRQFCWVHKLRDVKRHLPKGRHSDVAGQVRDAYMSETRDEARRKIASLASSLAVKHRGAADTLTRWTDELVGFYDVPAEHWPHVRSTNPIESMFSTLRLRTGKTRGKLGRERLGALLLKLAQTATANMNALPGADKIRLLLGGAVFKDGEVVEEGFGG